MNTQPVSPDPVELTRKTAAQIESEILRRLAEVKQTHAADCMGVHASTVSRLVAEDLGKFCMFLASIDCKVGPADSMMLSTERIEMLEDIAAEYFNTKRAQRRKAAV
jgi:predicted transcriptional regulator